MKSIKLSSSQRELVERLGVQTERSGLSPAQSRILALLIISDETELTFDEIYLTLKISKSAASNAINSLLNMERIDYITKPGDRKRYFRSRIGELENDFERKLSKMLEISSLFKEVLAQRPKSTKEFNSNIQNTISFMEFMSQEMPSVFKKWKKLKKIRN
jgi:DNA-binding transcriptional regulator GbsR (MarR family)